MTKLANQSSNDSLRQLIDLVVENRIRLDALNEVFKQTNPLVHELYLGEIENLRMQSATELARTIANEVKTTLRTSD